jgi:hypothetical protein
MAGSRLPHDYRRCRDHKIVASVGSMVLRFGAETEANSFHVSDQSTLSGAQGRLLVCNSISRAKRVISVRGEMTTEGVLSVRVIWYLWYQEVAAIRIQASREIGFASKVPRTGRAGTRELKRLEVTKATSNSFFPPPSCVSSYDYAFACDCVLTKLFRLGLNPRPIAQYAAAVLFVSFGVLVVCIFLCSEATFRRSLETGRAFDTLASICLNWNHGSSESARNAAVTACLHHNTTRRWSVVPKPSLANGSSIPLDRTPTARSRRECLRTVW